MTDSNWDSLRCNDRSGFLFSHDCDYPPVNLCMTCGRPICDEHTRYDSASQTICVTCAKQSSNQDPNNAPSNDDPYFYGQRHYRGYGHYGPGYWGHHSYVEATSHHDGGFTAGDSQALGDEDDATFESDMSES